MKTINANTKISKIINEDPAALKAIISISPKFNKLRNPLLRKLIASRTSIAMASVIGACKVNDFFEKLKPLGFEIDETVIVNKKARKLRPEFMENISRGDLVEMDVRALLDSGNDPFQLILEKLNSLKEKQVLKLINSFEPTPLIEILEKKGIQNYTETVDENLVFTFFYKTKHISFAEQSSTMYSELGWDQVIKKFENKTEYIDVRELEMPLPMLTIIDKLESLNVDKALFVYHKRIPVFLLPELKEKKFNFLIKEIDNSEVHLLIFKE